MTRCNTKQNSQEASYSDKTEKDISTKNSSNKSRGEIILSFLEEEVIMLKDMECEKTLYYDTPSKHPLYESEWRTFWKKKFDELRERGRI